MPRYKKHAPSSKTAAEKREPPQEIMSSVGGESEEDLTDLDPSIIAQTVVFATDWTTDTLLGQLAKGNIALDPSFQRRDAWTAQRKSKFIESIILGLPIPQLVLAENAEKKGTFIVIDGKQRLLSLQQFAGINLGEGADSLKLKGLEMLTGLNGKTYAELSNDSRLHDYRSAFENQAIRTFVVRNWQKENVLYLIFHRLNTGSVPLSPQELRQALHPGPFLTFVAKYSEASRGVQQVLGLDKPDFRMRDVELLVRYFAFRNYITRYSGNLKQFLDDACKELNKQWAVEKANIERQAEDFDAAVQAAFVVFGESPFRKWDGKNYERRFNRAVFDIVVYYFSDDRIRRKVMMTKATKAKVKIAFEQLCTKNLDFLRSLETTTKSKGATSTRFTAWGSTLQKSLGIYLDTPKLISSK